MEGGWESFRVNFLGTCKGLGEGEADVMTSEILFINAKYQLERNDSRQHFIHLNLLSSLNSLHPNH